MFLILSKILIGYIELTLNNNVDFKRVTYRN